MWEKREKAGRERNIDKRREERYEKERDRLVHAKRVGALVGD